MEENWSEALAQLERVWQRVAGKETPEMPPERAAGAPDVLAAERDAAQRLLEAAASGGRASAASGGRASAALREMAGECAAAAREIAAEEFLRCGALPERGNAPRAEGGLLPRLRAAYLALARAEAAYAAAGDIAPERAALYARLAAKKPAQRRRVFAIVAALMA